MIHPRSFVPAFAGCFAGAALAFLTALPAPGAVVLNSPNFSPGLATGNNDLRNAYEAHAEGRFGEAFTSAYKAVESDDPEAWFFLGWLHETGRGTRLDLEAANYAYTKAQEGGLVDAAFRRCGILLKGDEHQRKMARIILEELAADHPGIAGTLMGEAAVQGLLGTGPDYDAALKWWTLAAKAGESQAYVNLSRLQRGAYGFPEKADPVAATAALLKAAELGDASAMAELGRQFLAGPEEVRNVEQGLVWLKRAAKNDVSEADLFLGRYYGDNGSFSEARKHYEAAVDKENAPALFELGLLHQEGLGGEKSDEKALELFKAAAAQGQPAGAHYAGAIMLNATDQEKVVENIVGGYRFLLAAAAGNRPDAQVDLAMLYASGRLGVADPVAAAAWLDRAARAGSPAAQYNLAALFEMGTGVNRNLKSALNLYTLASQKGHPAAITALGRFHASGTAVDKNLPRAWALFSLATERGDKDGARLLADLTGEISPAELEAGRKEFESLKKGPPTGSTSMPTPGPDAPPPAPADPATP